MKQLVFFIFLCFTVSAYTQNEFEPQGSHTIHKQEIPPLLQYLFEKYGVEESELIMINIQLYEEQNLVKVLDQNTYLNYVENINAQIDVTSDVEKIEELQSLKSKVISVLSIEEQVLNQ